MKIYNLFVCHSLQSPSNAKKKKINSSIEHTNGTTTKKKC